MSYSKSPLSSVTVWGGLIALVPQIAEALNEVAALGVLPPQVSATIAAVGGVLAIIGRFRAKVPVKLFW